MAEMALIVSLICTMQHAWKTNTHTSKCMLFLTFQKCIIAISLLPCDGCVSMHPTSKTTNHSSCDSRNSTDCFPHFHNAACMKKRHMHVQMCVIPDVSEKRSLHSHCLRTMDVFQCIQHKKKSSLHHATAKTVLIVCLIFTMWHAWKMHTHARPDVCCAQCFSKMSLHSCHLHMTDVFQCTQHQKQPSIVPTTAETVLVFALVFGVGVFWILKKINSNKLCGWTTVCMINTFTKCVWHLPLLQNSCIECLFGKIKANPCAMRAKSCAMMFRRLIGFLR